MVKMMFCLPNNIKDTDHEKHYDMSTRRLSYGIHTGTRSLLRSPERLV